VLLGVGRGDGEPDADRLAEKVVHLRAFADEQGKMNRSVTEAGGGVLVVSQFTLFGDCRGGRRPSFTEAAEPAEAERLYLRFSEVIKAAQGPVTFLLDSRRAF
jgi:D-tyrosyl-tRNA(Tyr) deacylase